MRKLTIEVADKRRKKNPKTRSFSAQVLAYFSADHLWQGGTSAPAGTLRPVCMVLAGTEAGFRPFMANLLAGEFARIQDDDGDNLDSWKHGHNRLQLLKSQPYNKLSQRDGDRVKVQLFMPEVTEIEPQLLDEDMCEFVVIDPAWWRDEQLARIADDQPLRERIEEHFSIIGITDPETTREQNLLGLPVSISVDNLLLKLPLATRFALRLDRRTPWPVLNDPVFWLQIYLGAFAEGIASTGRKKSSHYRTESWTLPHWSGGVYEYDPHGLFCPITAFRAGQDAVGRFLAEQVEIYRQGVG